MDTMLGLVALAIITVSALFAALALNWACLRATFLLMQPATVNRRSVRPPIEQGARLVAQAYGRAR
jgi:hypothetical protein